MRKATRKTIDWSGVKADQHDLKVSVTLKDTQQRLTLSTQGQKQVFTLPSISEVRNAGNTNFELEFKLAKGCTLANPVWELKDARKNPNKQKQVLPEVAAANMHFKMAFSKANGGEGSLDANGRLKDDELRIGRVADVADARKKQQGAGVKPDAKNGAQKAQGIHVEGPGASRGVLPKGLPGGDNRCYFNALFQFLYGSPLLARLRHKAATKKDMKPFGSAIQTLMDHFRGTKVVESTIEESVDKAIIALNGIGNLKVEKGSQQDSEEVLTEVLRQFAEKNGDNRPGFKHEKISEESGNGQTLPRSFVNAAPTKENDNLTDILRAKGEKLDLREHLFVKISRHPQENQNITLSEKMNLNDKEYQLEAFTVHTGNHYIAYARREGDWYRFDDSTVEKISNISAELGVLGQQITMVRFKTEHPAA